MLDFFFLFLFLSLLEGWSLELGGESASINSLDSDVFILFPVLHDYAEVETNNPLSEREKEKWYLPVPILSD